MVRIIAEVDKYLTLNGIELTDIDGFYNTDTDRLLLLENPSEASSTRYQDGSRSGEFNFSLQSKRKSKSECIQKLTEIETILDAPKYFEIDKFILKTIDIVQSAHPILKDENNNMIYASDFKLSYYLDKE